MQVTIINKHLHLNDQQKQYIQEKLDHLKHLGERIDDESTQVRVDVETNSIKTSNKNISLQVTMYVPHAVIRAEVLGVTVEEALDLAVDKLKRQLERYKGRKNRRDQSGKWIPSSTLDQMAALQNGPSEVARVAKRKLFKDAHPMHEEEAIEQMELLDHNFYAFINSDNGKFNVVYRREDGSYGLFELDNK